MGLQNTEGSRKYENHKNRVCAKWFYRRNAALEKRKPPHSTLWTLNAWMNFHHNVTSEMLVFTWFSIFNWPKAYQILSCYAYKWDDSYCSIVWNWKTFSLDICGWMRKENYPFTFKSYVKICHLLLRCTWFRWLCVVGGLGKSISLVFRLILTTFQQHVYPIQWIYRFCFATQFGWQHIFGDTIMECRQIGTVHLHVLARLFSQKRFDNG